MQILQAHQELLAKIEVQSELKMKSSIHYPRQNWSVSCHIQFDNIATAIPNPIKHHAVTLKQRSCPKENLESVRNVECEARRSQ